MSPRFPGRERRHQGPAELDLPRWLVRNTVVRGQRPGLGGRLPLRWQRRYLDAFAGAAALPEGTVARPVDLGGTPALRVTVGATDRLRAVLYLHGGAYLVGSPTSHKSLTAYLARDAGAVVYSLAYPLAPEHPYPAARDAAVAAYRALVDEGFAPAQIAIAGDSAGGALALATCQALIALDRALRPAALALISPAVDIREFTDALDRRRARLDPVVRMRWGDAGRLAYVGTGDVEDHGITPVNGPLADLPPTIVHLDHDELLHDRVVDFVDRATEAGVDIVAHEYVGTWHVMHAHASVWQVARDAIAELGDFIRQHTGPAAPGPVPAATDAAHSAPVTPRSDPAPARTL